MMQALRKGIQRMHYPLGVMLTCDRWYVAYLLSLRHTVTDRHKPATPGSA